VAVVVTVRHCRYRLRRTTTTNGKKPTARIFQIPHRNHPSHFVLSVRRFIIPQMTIREGLKPSPTLVDVFAVAVRR
jgi:hypothetical protein